MRRIFILMALSAALFSAADEPAGKTGNADHRVITHKPLGFFKAVACDGKVKLTFCKTGRFFKKAEYDDLYKNIVIYRKKTDFVAFKDFAEFFDGMTCSDEDIIYSGPIELECERGFTYLDDTVSVGSTYAYWVGTAGSEPTGPYPVKVRDPRIWWSPETVSQEIQNLKEAYPSLVQVSVVGKTVEGRSIFGLEVGNARKKVALIGTIHASESGPELILPVIRNLLEHHREIFEDVSVVAIPCVNLDEKKRVADGVPWYLRRNAISVDLNRNFPGNWEEVIHFYNSSSADPGSVIYRGAGPASEPETQAVMAFIRTHHPEVVLSFHHVASVAGKLLLAPEVAAEGEEAKQKFQRIFDTYVEGYCAGFPDEKPNGVLAGNLLRFEAPKSGSLGVWCYTELGIPAFDIEGEKNAILKKSLTEDTDMELLSRNQQQHAAALLNLLQSMK